MPFLTDKVAVVTGGSSGVGKALAMGLAAEGATVCLVARNKGRLQAVLDNAPTHKPRLRSHVADLVINENIANLTTRLECELGHVDMLVHCAGVISLGPVESAPIEDLDRQHRCNVRGPFLMTQALLPELRVSGGQVVFSNSSAGLTAKANVGHQAASKRALKALADSLREEVNGDGVRVLNVYLGRRATPLQEEVHKNEGRTYHGERLIQPEEVAALVVRLLTVQQSSEITEVALRPMLKPLLG